MAYSGRLPQIKGVVSLYAPTEIREDLLMESAFASSMYDVVHSFFYLRVANLLCDRVTNETACLHDLSPLALVNREDLPRTLLVHGYSDSIVPVLHGKDQ